ncbi:MAG: type II secretion system protein [Burkholderiales bacterium]|nr:type II secretion system protein [Burkholderiales bacterium]
MANNNREAGFSLIELAVVMFIIVLLLGSILVPLTTQVEQRKVTETQKSLEQIREALLGFAVLYGRLPCPDTDTNPAAAGYGEEESACAAPTAEGYLPWKTLGVTSMDAFGITRTATGSPRVGDWRYRVHRNFAVAFNLTTGVASPDNLAVRDSANNLISSGTERPVAIVYSAGPNTVPDGQNASYEATNGIYQADVPSATFDDILIWISRPILINRMVSAGKLP